MILACLVVSPRDTIPVDEIIIVCMGVPPGERGEGRGWWHTQPANCVILSIKSFISVGVTS